MTDSSRRRDRFAQAAMLGLIRKIDDPWHLARQSVAIADALIATLDGVTPPIHWVITSWGERRVACIKELRNCIDMPLVTAKEITECPLPQRLVHLFPSYVTLSAEQERTLAKRLVACGARLHEATEL